MESRENKNNYYNVFNEKPRCFYVMKDFVSAKHAHKEAEIAYPVNGNIDVYIRDEVFHVGMMELLIIPSNIMHYYVKFDSQVEVINIKFIDDWLVPGFAEPGEIDQMKKFFMNVQHIASNPLISLSMSEMVSFQKTPFADLKLWGCLVKMVSEILDNTHWIKRSMKLDVESTRYIENLLLYVRENCFGELTLKMLADHVGLTESYCSKYFKDNVGMSFLEYVNVRRVSHAQRLLRYTDMSITEVIENSGFSSVQTFNRVFKKITGMTPSDYRKS